MRWMILFESDYNEGACPEILNRLIETNREQTSGYAEDPYSRRAVALIREKCKREDADVYFLAGGTQTNLTLISAALRPHQGAISAAAGHINVHEAGAVEATGHKVLTISAPDAKLTAEAVQLYIDSFYRDGTHTHMVQPKLVYISQPTELGTLYSLAELETLSEVCRKNHLYLYLDGARLGYALAAGGDVPDLPAIARLTDAFYFGGTKIGTLFGEALLIMNEELKEDFPYIMKQKGAVMAKGRIAGISFLTLFENDLYLEYCRHAVREALRIRSAIEALGLPFLMTSRTNQQFPILPDTVLEKLDGSFTYSIIEKMDDSRTAVRFCTSWATDTSAVDSLITALQKAAKSL
jgi:threonine aldolase